MSTVSEASPTNPLRCLHKGCQKTYTDANETCIYHPGPPEFHEGQKGWLCCKPRVLTFDEFLAIEGCTRGKHSATDDGTQQWRRENGKDETQKQGDSVMPKEKQKSEEEGQQGEVRKIKPISISDRTANSLAAAMTTTSATPRSTTPQPAPPESDSDDPEVDPTLSENMTCKRRSCNKSYSKTTPRQQEKCIYHPGVPLFHEGSKGWTCCKRRVLEFEEFLKIEGCKERTGHCYIGKKAKEKEKDRLAAGAGAGAEDELKDEHVRSDFYQTATAVIASFYLKKIIKETALVEFVDRQTVKLDLRTADGKRYKSDVLVWGEIEPSQCKYRILGTKLEVTLVKVDGGVGWPVLRATDRDTGERIQVGRAGRA